MDLASLMEQTLLKEKLYRPKSQRRSFSKTRPLGDGKMPDNLDEWVSFDKEVEQWWTKVKPSLEGRATTSFKRRGMWEGVITEEVDIRTCFSMCIAEPVTLAARHGLGAEVAMCSASSIGVGNADAGGFLTEQREVVSSSSSSDSDSDSDEASDEDDNKHCIMDYVLKEEVLPIEVKPKWQVRLHKSISIVAMMNSPDKKKVRQTLSQTFLYMVLEQSKYGVLTTKDKSVFLRQSRDGPLKILEVSRTICHNDPIGVRKCFLFMLMHAAESEEVPISQTWTTPETDKWIPPRKNKKSSPLSRNKMQEMRRKRKRGLNDQGSSYNGRRQEDVSLQLSDPEQFIVHLDEEGPDIWNAQDGGDTRIEDANEEEMESWVRSLQHFDLGYLHLVAQVKKSKYHSVWKGRVRVTDVAIKLYDFCESRQGLNSFYNEVSIYKKLESLQGSVIPFLVDYGLVWGGLLAFMATTWIGDEVNIDRLPLNKKASLLATVKKLHRSGVLHGDLCFSNFLHGKSRGKFFLVDFEFAKSDPSIQELHDEMVEFQTLLNS